MRRSTAVDRAMVHTAADVVTTQTAGAPTGASVHAASAAVTASATPAWRR